MTREEAITLMRLGKEKLHQSVEARKLLPNPQQPITNIQRVERIREIEKKHKATEEIPEEAPF